MRKTIAGHLPTRWLRRFARVMQANGFRQNGTIQCKNGKVYVMDFWHLRKQINIEIDGPDHRVGLRPMLDIRRDKQLEQEGWAVVRVRVLKTKSKHKALVGLK